MKYRKKPVVIEAFKLGIDHIPTWFMNKVSLSEIVIHNIKSPTGYCEIKTLEGTMRGEHGDYIIKGVNNEIYPCKPDIFEKTYDAVTEIN